MRLLGEVLVGLHMASVGSQHRKYITFGDFLEKPMPALGCVFPALLFQAPPSKLKYT